MTDQIFRKFNSIFLPYIFLLICLIAATILIKRSLHLFDIKGHLIYSVFYFISFGLFHFFMKEKYVSLNIKIKYSLLLFALLVAITLALV